MITLSEHYGYKKKKKKRFFLEENNLEFCQRVDLLDPVTVPFNNDPNTFCFKLRIDNEAKYKYQFETGYYIGVDWIEKDKLAINVQPKLNQEEKEIDYLSMLFEALQESENFNHLDNLYTIDFKAPLIEIEQKQDKLTPLIFIEFLQLLKIIVRKGLKKSYYKVTENLNSRVKGKILVNATVKQNHTKQKMLNTVCQYQEFGFNSIENRVLKKALLFVQSALNSSINPKEMDLKQLFHYIFPAFQQVDENIELREVKYSKPNPLFKEYSQALKLAKLILKKYSYNISKTTERKVKTPPFWIDMTKLFELYVFKKLREVYKENKEVRYHVNAHYQELDYLIKTNDNSIKMVVDAKYKHRYKKEGIKKEDARQVSGYSRLKTVYEKLGMKDSNELIDCLIIYPDQSISEEVNFVDSVRKKEPSSNYVQFYKVGVKLPEIF